MIDDPGWFAYAVSAFVIGMPLLVGIVSVGAGLRRWRAARRLATVGRRVTGVVADNQQVSESEGRLTFLPVVLFRTDDGREVRTVLDDAPSHRSHLTDVPIDLVYDPADPRRAATAGNRTGGGILAVAVGLVFVAFGIGAYALVTRSGMLDTLYP